jgi:uncharacterized protein YndB with AHSA1/START domain
VYSTRVSAHVNAPRPAVYQALVDADAVAKWRVPEGMTGHVHEFDAREGGSFRISLNYDAPGMTGKSAPRTDTYHGHFARLVPDEQVVEVLEFETADPALGGTMTMPALITAPTAALTSWSCTKGFPTACPPPTTRPAPGWHWATSPGSSRRTNARRPGPDTRRGGAPRVSSETRYTIAADAFTAHQP